MKAEINAPTKKAFAPFSLTITFENIDEARLLWNRLNISCFHESNVIAWKVLNEYMLKNGLFNNAW